VGTEESGRGLWLGLLRLVGRVLLRMPRVLTGLLAAAWMTLIWRLSSQTLDPIEPSFLISTFYNLAHAPLFGILTLFLAAAFLARPRGAWPVTGLWQLAPILAAVLLYAIVDEWHQSLTPGRDPSIMDVTTDLVAGSCTLWVIAYLGPARASERGLRGRLLVGCALCILSSSLCSLL